jgi:hypothetical protein
MTPSLTDEGEYPRWETNEPASSSRLHRPARLREEGETFGNRPWPRPKGFYDVDNR